MVSGSHFNLLDWLHQDSAAVQIFSFEETVRIWVQVEIALAQCQNKIGLIPDNTLAKIQKLKNFQIENEQDFRIASINVGYPIVELLRELNATLEIENQGFLHLGATTQDIMDTALAMQVQKIGTLLINKLIKLGDLVADLAQKHRETVMAGRTHGQQAVPITFGFKLSVYLAELNRHLKRAIEAFDQAGTISMYGAGGTSAAYGGQSAYLRREMSSLLKLKNENIPWHVSRDRFIETTSVSAAISTTLTRLAREIIDLSRTEILEVSEPGGWHKGSSSTMPQKRNPVMSEAIIGLGVNAAGNATMMFRAGEAGHERAAGEWQLEWKVLPESLISTTSALKLAIEIFSGLQVNVIAMKENLLKDYGLILSEAFMINLAPKLGREKAHDLVYKAVEIVRREGGDLFSAITQAGGGNLLDSKFSEFLTKEYLGESLLVVDEAINSWARATEIVKKGYK